jgi:hypothetical protein
MKKFPLVTATLVALSIAPVSADTRPTPIKRTLTQRLSTVVKLVWTASAILLSRSERLPMVRSGLPTFQRRSQPPHPNIF